MNSVMDGEPHFRSLVTRTRSCRRFRQERQVSVRTLRDLVDLARLAASGANLQPLKYVIVNEPALCAEVFAHLAWAAYLKDWKGPAEGERPSAYVIVLHDRLVSASPGCDHGFAVQSLLLGATAAGLGGCVIGSVRDKAGLAGTLGLPENFEMLLVVALGEPAETIVLEEAAPGGSIKYWRDEEDRHHVPKRPLAEVLVAENPTPRKSGATPG